MNKIYLIALFFIGTFVSSGFAQDVTDGLLARYEFNGNADDIVGNNNGIIQGVSLANDRFNNSNSAYFFNGIDNYIEIPDNSLLDFEHNRDFSISLWVNISTIQNDLSGTNNDILGKWNSQRSMSYPYAIRYWNENASEERKNKIFNLRYDTETCNHNPLITGDCYISSDEWHHLVFLKRGNLLEYYQDNVLFGSTTDNTTSQCNTTNNNRILIGKRTLGGRFFTGLIDDISFYDRALEINEINILFSKNEWSSPVIADALITSFEVPNQIGSSIIDNQNKSIDLMVTCDTDIADLIATFSLSGSNVDVYVNDIVQISGNSSNNFAELVIYTLKNKQICIDIEWTVNIQMQTFSNEELANSTQVLEFNIPNQIGITELNNTIKSINITVPCYTELSSLNASFLLPPETTAFVNDKLQVSGLSINNFSKPLIYSIYSNNTCNKQDWLVSVSLETFEGYEIRNSTLFISYYIDGQIGMTEIDSDLAEIKVYMPCDHNLSQLTSTFILSEGATSSISGNEQKSEQSINDFSSFVTYSVNSSNGCFNRDWKIQITPKKLEIEAFDLSNQISIIPNIITPNGDNYNERFELGESLIGSELIIVNRHGIKVFESGNYKNQFTGSSLSSGIYYYAINSVCFKEPITGYLSIMK